MRRLGYFIPVFIVLVILAIITIIYAPRPRQSITAQMPTPTAMVTTCKNTLLMTSTPQTGTGFGSPYRLLNDRIIYQENGRQLTQVSFDGIRKPLVVSDTSISEYILAPDRQSIIYVSNQNEITKLNLKDGVEVPLNKGFEVEGRIRITRFLSATPFNEEGNRIFYEQGGNVYSIYANELNQPVRIITNDFNLGAARLSPDGRYLVFFAASKGTKTYHLYSVPTDGSSSPIILTDENLTSDDVSGGWISADSQSVIFHARKSDGEWNAYRVPIDASRASEQFDATFSPERFVEAQNAILISASRSFDQDVGFTRKADTEYLQAPAFGIRLFPENNCSI
jgi:WD40-like Beta Propeller Repeat